jgi:hypothetical protein
LSKMSWGSGTIFFLIGAAPSLPPGGVHDGASD